MRAPPADYKSAVPVLPITTWRFQLRCSPKRNCPNAEPGGFTCYAATETVAIPGYRASYKLVV